MDNKKLTAKCAFEGTGLVCSIPFPFHILMDQTVRKSWTANNINAEKKNRNSEFKIRLIRDGWCKTGVNWIFEQGQQ